MSNRRRKNTSYIVQTDSGDHRMPGSEFHRHLAAGLLCRISDRIAKPARNVICWLEEGKLQLMHIGHWIYTSWIAIDRTAPKKQVEPDEFDQLHCGLKLLRWSVITEVRLHGIPKNAILLKAISYVQHLER